MHMYGSFEGFPLQTSALCWVLVSNSPVLFGEVGQVGVVQMFSQNMNHLKNPEESGVFSMHFRHM